MNEKGVEKFKDNAEVGDEVYIRHSSYDDTIHGDIREIEDDWVGIDVYPEDSFFDELGRESIVEITYTGIWMCTIKKEDGEVYV